ncbi:phosphatase PAP2 family protein [archaeon]|jgi:undecaprenyl-diphosphatase|nr:phosphatase PAP2 family protein [archaeon]
MGVDNIAYEFMQSIESSWLTNSSEFIAIITEPIVLLVLSFLIGGLIYFKKSKLEGLFFAGLVLIAGVSIKVFKYIFHQARPLNSLIAETGYSLPSGHATMAVVFFGLIFYLFIKRKTLLSGVLTSLIILLIGFTRIYLRVHWLTDILAGYVLGGLILWIGIWVYRKIK